MFQGPLNDPDSRVLTTCNSAPSEMLQCGTGDHELDFVDISAVCKIIEKIKGS
jgi:hypothetical protein